MLICRVSIPIGSDRSARSGGGAKRKRGAGEAGDPDTWTNIAYIHFAAFYYICPERYDPDLALELVEDIGYRVKHNVFRVSGFGVPQTRRRFIFIASVDPFPSGFFWPAPQSNTPASAYLGDIAANPSLSLPNHNPEWGFVSSVHVATNEPFDPKEPPVPCRFSRTGSDGHPLRSLDAPFPAVDTATIWGWAQGNVEAARKPKDRANGKYIRNPDSDITLWRIRASRLRSFTHREYARLQTFPDSWVFHGGNKRHVHKQIGNAVPCQFAHRIAEFVSALHECQVGGRPMSVLGRTRGAQPELNL